MSVQGIRENFALLGGQKGILEKQGWTLWVDQWAGPMGWADGLRSLKVDKTLTSLWLEPYKQQG